MSEQPISIWYDPDWDALEILWNIEGNPIDGVPTDNDHVMAFVDQDDNVQGFIINRLSQIVGKPFEMKVKPRF